MTDDTQAFDAEATRAELRAWLDLNWDPELSLVEWRTRSGRRRLGLPDVAAGVVRPRSPVGGGGRRGRGAGPGRGRGCGRGRAA